MRVIQKKICLLGDFSVGKTSLIRRYVENKFDDKYLSTIGVKISRKSLELPDTHIKFLIWDIAGEDIFQMVQSSYLRGAAGALIVCDITRQNTLSGFPSYTERFRAINPESDIVYLANKNDLEDQREMSDEEIQKTCQELNGPYQSTSAKTGENVDSAFDLLANMILQTHESA